MAPGVELNVALQISDFQIIPYTHHMARTDNTRKADMFELCTVYQAFNLTIAGGTHLYP